jgi:hypothetical protein
MGCGLQLMEHNYGLRKGAERGGGRLAAAANCYGDQRKVCGWLSVLKASHQSVVIIVMGDFAIVVEANQLTVTVAHRKRLYQESAGDLYE